MPKVYLSPAYHYWNVCSIPGCDETTHNNEYLDELVPYLDACGIEYKRGTRRVPRSNEDGADLTDMAIDEANAWGADLYYISHTNAFDGRVDGNGNYIQYGSVKGYRPMIYSKSGEAWRWAQIMMKWRQKIYEEPSAIYVNSSLEELNRTKMPALYEEHVFHDNPEDAKWFHDNLRKIAEYAARGFCEYFGIDFVDPYVKKPEAKGFWRLYEVSDVSKQVGAYSFKEGLLTHVEKLLDEGKAVRYEKVEK